ncbi:MAG: 2-oxoacid:acceptor oxidoreductase family protein [Christensenellales bacterium]|jgi:2-oxoglutarate ferredoxin oxidoreductase subunit gamma
MATHSIIIAGFGGQGVLSMGQLLAYAGMLEGKEVSWLPSYGPEMRGGTANVNVIISDEQIGSPVITSATELMALNRPSLDKFEKDVCKGGIAYVNSSLASRKLEREDITGIYMPINEMAAEIEFPRGANMIMLGSFIKRTGVVSIDSVMQSLREVLGESKEHLLPINRKALELGEAFN